MGDVVGTVGPVSARAIEPPPKPSPGDAGALKNIGNGKGPLMTLDVGVPSTGQPAVPLPPTVSVSNGSFVAEPAETEGVMLSAPTGATSICSVPLLRVGGLVS